MRSNRAASNSVTEVETGEPLLGDEVASLAYRSVKLPTERYSITG